MEYATRIDGIAVSLGASIAGLIWIIGLYVVCLWDIIGLKLYTWLDKHKL